MNYSETGYEKKHCLKLLQGHS